MRAALAGLFALTLAACGGGASAELACQQRLDGAANESLPNQASFGAEAYARVERSGCTPPQLAMLDRLTALTRELPNLAQANEAAALSGDNAAHSAAFERMIQAVGELNQLQKEVRDNLASMEQAQ
jgi:hypothetical protein